MTFEFKCANCDEVHYGVPGFRFPYPFDYFLLPEGERQDSWLGSDDCVIAHRHFFIRGCLDIPVHGETEALCWGVWLAVSRDDYDLWRSCYDESKRSHLAPFPGALNIQLLLSLYPDTLNLPALVHLRDDGILPYVQLEAADHPLTVEQRQGISHARLIEIYTAMKQ